MDSIESYGLRLELDGKSDHTASVVVLQLSTPVVNKRARRPVQRSWKPRLSVDGFPAEFHESLDTALELPQASLKSVGQAVVEAASQCGVSRDKAQHKHPPEIEALFKSRREETDPALRKQLSHDLWKALRKQRRQRRENEIAEVAERGQGLRRLMQVKGRHSGVDRASEIADRNGNIIQDSDGIA